MWNAASGKCVHTTSPIEASQQAIVASGEKEAGHEEGQNITQLLYSPTHNTVTVVTYQHNISILDLEKKLTLKKQVCIGHLSNSLLILWKHMEGLVQLL